jgi:signal transduction histidine kinase
MLRPLNWLARALGYAWIGVLTFGLDPPPPGHPAALAIQAAGFSLGVLGLAGWALIDYYPQAARHRARLLPVVLAIIAIATGLASALGNGGTSMVVFGFIAAMMAGSDTSLGAAVAVTAAGILAIEVGGLAGGGSYGTLLGLPAVLAGGLMIGRNRAAYRIQAEQAAALLAQREQFEAEQRRADLLDERARIAREIHDVLAHSLGALGIQIQAARSVLTDRGDVAKADEMLAAAQRMAAEGLTDTRRAVHALRTDTLPLDQELATVTDVYAQRYGVAATLRSDGIPRPVPPDATVALLRIAQEALVNAAKHAAGQPVTLLLDYRATDVRLTVSNDMTPLPPDDSGAAARPALVSTANTGYGLTGMRERLLMLNGTLETGGHDGQWVVTAQLPLASAGERHP